MSLWHLFLSGDARDLICHHIQLWLIDDAHCLTVNLSTRVATTLAHFYQFKEIPIRSPWTKKRNQTNKTAIE